MNEKLFDRLQSNIFGNLSDIQVDTRNSDGVYELSPFEGHLISKEPATTAGLSCICRDLHRYMCREEYPRVVRL
jgi:hypothetical protein